jgi:hypothetical protein
MSRRSRGHRRAPAMSCSNVVNDVLLPGRRRGSNWSGVLVQVKGWQRSFHPSMKVSIAAMRSLAEVKLPRRIACRVMIPKKKSMFSHDRRSG